MRLREWQDSNGKKVSTASSSVGSASGTSSGSFKKRLDKLITYYGQHLPARVDYLTVELLTNDKLEFTEHWNTGDNVEVKIYIGPATEAWRLKVSKNSKYTDDLVGTGWIRLLRELRSYITVPVVSTPEYKDLLTEWLDAKGNKVSPTSAAPTKTSSTSSGYKKRFEKLIKYHIDHASSELESITRKDIKDYSFRLGEHYNDGNDEFDRDILVAYDSSSDTFFIHIFVDRKEVESMQCDSYENFVKAIEPYMFLPDAGTREYDDLLEWVDSTGKKVSQPSSMSSTPSASSKTNKEKFKELTDYMIKYKGSLVSKAEVVRLDDGGFTYKEYGHSPSGQDYILTLLVGYSRFNSSWRYELYIDTSIVQEVQGSGWEELLEKLEKYFHVPKAGSKEYDSLCESFSMADDFKTYETLWD